MSLDFLKKIQIEEVAVSKTSGGGRRKEWNPTLPNSIRVWNTGKVFPSAELVERFSLEYGDKPAEKQKPTGNAIDVFQSDDCPAIKGLDSVLLFANITPKAGGKTDLFGSTGYDEAGKANTSVMDQGAATYGKDSLIPMIEKVYGLKFAVEEKKDKDDKITQEAVTGSKYVDLVLLGVDGEVGLKPFPLGDGKTICHVPKMISRGDKAGQMTYERRENPILFVLYPATLLANSGANLSEKTKEVEETVNEKETVGA